MTRSPEKMRWAPRLPPRLLERLYESDARGIRDEELCDEVGLRLLERCRVYVLVSRRELDCPSCGELVRVAERGKSACANCGWETDSRTYHTSLTRHYAFPGRALESFERFHRHYPRARDYATKLRCIDELIHAVHVAEAREVVKSAASKLLEGNKNEVVRFLDSLSARDPQAKRRWRESLSTTIHGRLLGAAPTASPEESE